MELRYKSCVGCSRIDSDYYCPKCEGKDFYKTIVNPNEFRLGNLVEVDNPDYHPKLKDIPLIIEGIQARDSKEAQGRSHCFNLAQINQKNNNYYQTYSQFIKYIKPIPLTKEWLIKFGFNKYYLEADSKCENDAYWCRCDKITFPSISNKTWKVQHTDIKCTYIHQLQNLYFALTNKELVFKSPNQE